MQNPAPPTRLTSVDALRGLTIAFMILVNDPGDWSHVYPPLDHARWNGFTPTDLVFPTFLFLVGCAIVFSLSSRLARAVSRRTLALQILRRAALLFALKLFLDAYPHFHLTNLRLYGVLTRIAIVYLLAALLFLFVRRPRTLLLLAAALLLGYWALLRFVPVPGLGHPVADFPILDPTRNLAAWLDRQVSVYLLRTLHVGRLYLKTSDPEGLLSTLPALATTLLGMVTALFLRRDSAPGTPRWHRPRTLALAALLLLAAGAAWNPWLPINKNLWTSSYVLFAGGWTLALLAFFYLLFDTLQVQRHRPGRALLWPLLVFGTNAIAAFVVSEFLVETFLAIKLHPTPDRTVSLWATLYHQLFARAGSTANTSLAFACCYVAVCFLPNWLLYRRRIFLRL